jgi:hypothetical protein
MNTNRRNSPRFSLKIPVRLQRLDLLDAMERTVVSSNVSEGGIHFSSTLPLEVGTPLRLFLNMPIQISGKPFSRRCYEGRVIHVNQNGQLSNEHGNEHGIGVAFHCDNVLPTRFEPLGNLSQRAADRMVGYARQGLAFTRNDKILFWGFESVFTPLKQPPSRRQNQRKHL